MSLTYSIAFEDSRINVVTDGIFDYMNTFEMWEAILASCAAHDCRSVLGISRIGEPVPNMDAYDHMCILQAVGVTTRHRIAWVAGNERLLDKLRVSETVLRNRASFDVRVFESVRAAKRWLKKSADH